MDSIDSGRINGRISAVISNKDGVFGLERARNAGIATEVLDHKQFDSRKQFDAAMAELIDSYAADLVVLAGFMRILTPEFVRHFQGRMLNIHPSLLPKYKGLHTHQRALEAGDSQHGCTVHFVTEELDGGPLLVQGAVSIDPDDTEESLQQKVHKVEHQIYPLAVEWLCADRAKWTSEGVILDDSNLGERGFQYQQN